MKFKEKISYIYSKINRINNKYKKKIIFCIGNTVKEDLKEYYFTPTRVHKDIIIFGIIVFNDKYAKMSSKFLDGKVDYIMVDAEKKIKPKKDDIPGNIERRVRESVKKSKILIYKGNDLTVDAIDLFLTYFFKDNIRGLGGKKVMIIGAGNIGSKLAQILLERGSRVFINRRNQKKCIQIAKTINLLKPKNTFEKVYPIKNFEKISKSTDILIGSTNGIAVISEKIVSNLKKSAIIIDAGKGTIENKAMNLARKRKILIFRTDVTAALLGLIHKSMEMEKITSKNYKINSSKDYSLITQGLLGCKDDIVVDDVKKPKSIYGICDGKGDFVRDLSYMQKKKLQKLKSKFQIKL